MDLLDKLRNFVPEKTDTLFTIFHYQLPYSPGHEKAMLSFEDEEMCEV